MKARILLFISCSVLSFHVAIVPKLYAADLRLSLQNNYATFDLSDLRVSTRVWSMGGYATDYLEKTWPRVMVAAVELMAVKANAKLPITRMVLSGTNAIDMVSLIVRMESLQMMAKQISLYLKIISVHTIPVMI